MKKQKIKIDIVSDVNCPWCYVGEQRLNKAMAQSQDRYDFEVSFKPFELNAAIGAKGMTRYDYYVNQYGPETAAQLDSIDQRLTDAGNGEGIALNFDRIATVNNTFNCHRLIWLAESYGVQKEVANALFYSYFTEGRDTNDTDFLTQTGMSHGIPAERLNGFFEGEEGKKEVRALQAWAQAAGIRGVPAFVINDQYLVSGAQPAETLQQVFTQVAPALEVINTPGDSCDVDGNC